MVRMPDATWLGEQGARESMDHYHIVRIHTIAGSAPARAAHCSTHADGRIGRRPCARRYAPSRTCPPTQHRRRTIGSDLWAPLRSPSRPWTDCCGHPYVRLARPHRRTSASTTKAPLTPTETGRTSR